MAMTKKEKEAFQSAIYRAELLAALRWTSQVDFDVAVPIEGYAEGWVFNSYSQCVNKNWSSRVSHGKGNAPTSNADRYLSASQGARRMFSTEVKALAAMRHAIEQECAAKLLAIDKRIQMLEESRAEKSEDQA